MPTQQLGKNFPSKRMKLTRDLTLTKMAVTNFDIILTSSCKLKTQMQTLSSFFLKTHAKCMYQVVHSLLSLKLHTYSDLFTYMYSVDTDKC